MPPILDEDRFEGLLESGDFNTAARQLFASPTTLLIETGTGDEPVRAVIGCAILERRIDGTGDQPAAAILSAWANWLVALRLAFGVDLDDDPLAEGDWFDPNCKSACPGSS